jgi:alkanesulfonate monooxygenase SsuD/methylene tetrahydromethanopterin reductase-like flavin-dependent oxidoreductase (luciferase family)
MGWTPTNLSLPTGWLPPGAADFDIPFGSRCHNFYYMAVHQNLTLRRAIALSNHAIGHNAPTGAVEDVADHLQEWFEAGACDGFAITPMSMPQGLDDACQLFVPAL